VPLSLLNPFLTTSAHRSVQMQEAFVAVDRDTVSNSDRDAKLEVTWGVLGSIGAATARRQPQSSAAQPPLEYETHILRPLITRSHGSGYPRVGVIEIWTQNRAADNISTHAVAEVPKERRVRHTH
jgi:hypothetical protein